MNTRITAVFMGIFLTATHSPSQARADVILPHIFGDNMVLQRDKPIPVWGWAVPNEEISVELAGSVQKTKADADGGWMVTLPPQKAGGPYEMAVKGGNGITFTNVLIGEVWLASGQSNMAFVMRQLKNAEDEIGAADYPDIRLCRVTELARGAPQRDVNAKWRVCNPGNAANFSAVAYFFGRRLRNELGIPVGLIDASAGGTPIEPWIALEGFASVPELKETLDKVNYNIKHYHDCLRQSLDKIEVWVKETRKAFAEKTDIPPSPVPAYPRLNDPKAPAMLYNSRIHPLAPFAIRGVIWYHGESNLYDGLLYFNKMKALIEGWRKAWNQGDFPFYYVQIAPYKGTSEEFTPLMWEAQKKALVIPNTGMAVINDIGKLSDRHPLNKQDVGRRLALWALAKTYGRDKLVYSGPLYKSMAVEGGMIRIRFDHAGSGLAARDGNPLDWFEIAGQDMKFVNAKAVIDGETVVVSASAVTNPVAVRFAWHEEAEPNLMNNEKLPAVSFRTCTW